jgi:tellurite resistance protein TerC
MIEHTKKILRLVIGSVLIVAGLALSLPGIPGPGIAVVILGLSVLSTDFEFARRWMHRIKATGHRILHRKRDRNVAM